METAARIKLRPTEKKITDGSPREEVDRDKFLAARNRPCIAPHVGDLETAIEKARAIADLH
jgi:hypothetical protein